MLSIIIPTLNEEKYLPRLLKSIKNQTYQNYEIIVADNGSADKTREIAQQFNCKIVKGGLPGAGRNSGANAAKGRYLLFLDADVILPKNFLETLLSEFNNRRLDTAACACLPISSKKIDNLLYGIYNYYSGLVQYFFPHALGACILSKKEIHHIIGGFDEGIKLAEDAEYAMRAAKYGKFRYLKTPEVSISMRRFDADGRLRMSLKYVLSEFYLIFVSNKIKTDIFKYHFAHYSKPNKISSK